MTGEQDEQSISDAPSYEALQKLLEEQRQKTLVYEDKLKHALADFQNMSRKTQTDIENGVNAKVDELLIEFLKVYDDLERAKLALPSRDVDAGLDSILKNMDSLLVKYDVKPIDALGEIFDPNVHEAITVINDPNLDDDTITKEIRKGYISRNKVIRPTLVEISKKVSQNE
ncbi:MAG: nucleotide exchange factor GrpE [Thaumarchaeota archaeon]|nr:nucleotide exchange factor GrpE [Nitrososphaerota archaeon]